LQIVQWVKEQENKAKSLRWNPVVPGGAWGWGAAMMAVLVVIVALIGAAANVAGLV
jgi:hypothetical protein